MELEERIEKLKEWANNEIRSSQSVSHRHYMNGYQQALGDILFLIRGSIAKARKDESV